MALDVEATSELENGVSQARRPAEATEQRAPRVKTSSGAPGRLQVQDVAAWSLRAGVITSVSVMLLGLLVSFLRHPPTVQQMEHTRNFDYRFTALLSGILHGDGPSIVGLGVFLLVLTPIARVAISMVTFAIEEKDRLYAVITFFVLAMTLVSLILLH